MGLATDELAAIEELLATESSTAQTGDANARANLRERFPWLSVTRCDASDMDAESPFRVFPGLNMFLVDASDHCWRITSAASEQ